ncbi:HAMP domain-containing histidine kinase [Patescibacteria group bacterium]|nr:HAMP domain-containing histidine kinase [Patescibacteria group bacterium]
MEIGKPGYLNENCWLVKTLNHTPYKRCQHCELKFRNCLFLHYQIISSILIIFFLTLSFLIEGKISKLVIISVFTLVIVYGYFFNKSTDKIIKANFTQRKANEALEELTENLQQKVDEQTQEIRKAYEVEKKAHQELKRLDEAKNQFIMATQHHLRTPLTSMIGYLDLIFGGTYGKVSPKIKDALLKFQVSTRRLIKIVNEFLDITQFQLGKEVVSLKPNIDIRPIFKEIIEELQFEAKARGIYLKLQKPGKIPRIKADPEKLRIALFNIVDNGIKYTPKGGVIVRCQPSDNKLQITVKDTGMGIPKEELKTLFTKTFERSKEAKKVYGTGRGIGLFITGHIIKAHNGKIWAESEGKDKGSTFYIELPVK